VSPDPPLPPLPLSRLALVVHPTRTIDAVVAAVHAWADPRGIDVVQLGMDGDAGREVAPRSPSRPGDLIVAIGGDGTVLWALRGSAEHRVPVLGVACGSLGALSVVGTGDVATALDRVTAGDWVARSLPVLQVEGDTGETAWAVNDFVVLRRGGGQLIAELEVDGERYVRIAGDGLVVATPLGSSAYTMAAGGPVLAAGTEAFACTPIAMHGGCAAPLVVPARSRATLTVDPGHAGFDVEIDGQRRPLDGTRFEVSFASDRLTLVTFADAGRGLTGLRRRGLITDSPRVLARDAREA
jgi:NAD+ kinase